MEPQTNKGLIVGIIIVVVLAVATGVYYSWPKEARQDEEAIVTEEQDAIDSAVQSILVQHTYENGEHIYRGVLDVPTPCHEIATDVRVLESFPEKVRIALSIVPPAPDVVCAQVVTSKSFEVRYKASETALAGNGDVTLDGKTVLFLTGGKD